MVNSKISVGSYEVAVSATGFHMPNFPINTELDSEVFRFNVYINLTGLGESTVAGSIAISGGQDGAQIRESFHILNEDGHADTENFIMNTSETSIILERKVIYVQQLSEPGGLKILLTVSVAASGENSLITFTQAYTAYVTVLPGKRD